MIAQLLFQNGASGSCVTFGPLNANNYAKEDKQAISMAGSFQPARLTRLGLAHPSMQNKADDYGYGHGIVLSIYSEDCRKKA